MKIFESLVISDNSLMPDFVFLDPKQRAKYEYRQNKIKERVNIENERKKERDTIKKIKNRFNELKTVLLPENTVKTYNHFMETKLLGKTKEVTVEMKHKGLRNIQQRSLLE